MEVFPDSGCQESLVSGDLISPLGLVLDQKRKKRIQAVNGARVSCLGSTSFQITYDGQTTNVLALVTTALSKEIVLSWRALQRLKVLPEDFPRAQTTVKANQIQSTKYSQTNTVNHKRSKRSSQNRNSEPLQGALEEASKEGWAERAKRAELPEHQQ